jgi:hypothetical protein
MALLLVLAACGDDDASGNDAARFCEVSAQLEEAAPRSGTPEAFENFFDVEMALVEEGLTVVPAEIRSDFDLTASMVGSSSWSMP